MSVEVMLSRGDGGVDDLGGLSGQGAMFGLKAKQAT
jgi:hypothetical protein